MWQSHSQGLYLSWVFVWPTSWRSLVQLVTGKYPEAFEVCIATGYPPRKWPNNKERYTYNDDRGNLFLLPPSYHPAQGLNHLFHLNTNNILPLSIAIEILSISLNTPAVCWPKDLISFIESAGWEAQQKSDRPASLGYMESIGIDPILLVTCTPTQDSRLYIIQVQASVFGLSLPTFTDRQHWRHPAKAAFI